MAIALLPVKAAWAQQPGGRLGEPPRSRIGGT